MIYGLKCAALWEGNVEECRLRQRQCNKGEINNKSISVSLRWRRQRGDTKVHTLMKTRSLSKTNGVSYCSSLRLQHRVEHMVWGNETCRFVPAVVWFIFLSYPNCPEANYNTLCSDCWILKSGGSQWMCRTRWMLLCALIGWPLSLLQCTISDEEKMS